MLLSDDWHAHSDLWEYFLPAFLSPSMLWSPYEAGGIPVFADPSSVLFYPLRHLFGQSQLSWSLYILTAFILIAVFSYLYFLKITDCVFCAVVGSLIFSLSHAVLAKIPHLTSLQGFIWFPLVLLTIEQLIDEPRVGWIFIGSLGTACLVLSGHTPHVVYMLYATGLYAFVACLATKAGVKSWLAVAGIFVFGVLLSAIHVVPLIEALGRLTRDQLSYDAFVGRSLSIGKFWVLAFHPGTFIDNDYREAPVYVGIGALFLAALSLTQVRQNWRIVFFGLMGLLAVLAALGRQTPVAGLLLELPLFDRGRNISRILFLYSFAIAVLSAFSLTYIRTKSYSWRTIVFVGVFLSALCVLSLYYGTQHEQLFEATIWSDQDTEYFRIMVDSHIRSLIGFQIGFVILLTLSLALIAWTESKIIKFSAVSLVLLIIGFDLVVNNQFGVKPQGIPFHLIPQQSMTENIHLAEIRKKIDAQHQRAGGIISHGKEALAFGVTSRLWKFHHLGTYSPIQLRNYHELFRIGNNGEVSPEYITFDQRGLDLAAVRYIWLPHEDITRNEAISKLGVTISAASRQRLVGHDDCNEVPKIPYRQRIYLAEPTLVQGIIFVGATRCGAELPQGTSIGSLLVHGRDGQTFEQPLRVGIETADRALGLNRVKERGGSHRPVTVFAEELRGDEGVLYSYVSRYNWPSAIDADYIEFELKGTQVSLLVDYITLIDAQGVQKPVDPLRSILADPRKWRFVKSIMTSRTTDRASDEVAEGEIQLDIYENLRALPRAWIAPAVRALKQGAIIDAIATSHFWDNSPFDPQEFALLEEGSAELPTGGGRGSAEVLLVSPTEIRVQTHTDGPAFLVLSDAWYPGWEAWLGDQKLKVYQADLALRLVAVPQGDHIVTFRFRPHSLVIGASISAATLIVLVLALLSTALRQYARLPASKR